MAEQSKIEWTDHTFNPWIGCQKVSPACDNCYAEAWAERFGQVRWGPGEARKRTSAVTWRQPYKWDKAARETGKPAFVFCASLADVFDNAVDHAWRADLFDLIRATPNLVWMVLTKRPQNIAKMLPPDWGDGWPHVWLGTTVEDQKRADMNVPALLTVPAARRFLSCEPLLGPVDLQNISAGNAQWNCLDRVEAREAAAEGDCDGVIDWVICGGESGQGARPMHPDWARDLRDQCAREGVPFFFKQWGDWSHLNQCETPPPRNARTLHNGHVRLGKAKAGRKLDGCTHDARPPPQPP